jgi:aryl-phospho-beta-D-glucosidase BglC (GH1 family)
MGGEECNDCSACAASEFDLTKKLGQTKANAAFQKHWRSWLNQTDIDTLVELGINAVRIPMGFWILEGLVDRSSEYYAQGALPVSRRARLANNA